MKYVHYILRNTLCRGLKFERGRVYNRSVYSGINLISFPPLHFEIWFSFPIFLTQTHTLENCVRPFCILSMSCVYHFQLFNQRRKKREQPAFGNRFVHKLVDCRVREGVGALLIRLGGLMGGGYVHYQFSYSTIHIQCISMCTKRNLSQLSQVIFAIYRNRKCTKLKHTCQEI